MTSSPLLESVLVLNDTETIREAHEKIAERAEKGGVGGRLSTLRVVQTLAKLAVLLGLGIAALSISTTIDRSELERTLRALGSGAWLVFIPPLGALLVETLGWAHVLAATGYSVRLERLFFIRGATEALATFLPGGALLGESVKPALLEKEGVPLASGVGAVAHRKYLRVLTHGLFIASISLLGTEALERFSKEKLGILGLSLALFMVGIALFGASLFARMGLANGSYAARFLRWVRNLRPSVRQKSVRIEGAFERTDEATRKFFSLPLRTTAPALFACFAAWVLESSEAYVLLRLLGQDVSFLAVLALDTGVSLLRQGAVFLPGGVLVQELGYLAVLPALGVSDPVHIAAAFLLVKRTRELVMGLAFSLFFLGGRSSLKAPEPLVGSS